MIAPIVSPVRVDNLQTGGIFLKGIHVWHVCEVLASYPSGTSVVAVAAPDLPHGGPRQVLNFTRPDATVQLVTGWRDGSRDSADLVAELTRERFGGTGR